jgi:hypothetical protein
VVTAQQKLAQLSREIEAAETVWLEAEAALEGAA